MPQLALIAGTALSFVGTLAQASALNEQATAEQQAAAYKAREEQRVAQENRAAAQRKALQTRREGEYTQSKLQAAAAASGGGADDPTIIKLSSDIAGQSEYSALSEMFTGESRAIGLENQAQLDIYSGNVRANALRSRANQTILGGFGGLFGALGGRRTTTTSYGWTP